MGEPRIILVTGANGFIGSAVVAELVKRRLPVLGLVRESSSLDRLDGLDCELVPGDLRDRDAIRSVLESQSIWGVIHLAGLSSWNDIDSPLLDEVVVEGTARLVELARSAGVRRFVYVSSTLAAGGARSPAVVDESAPLAPGADRLPYSRAKVQAEQICRRCATADFEPVIVRPAEVYGPHDTDLITAGNLIDFVTSWPVLVCRGGTSVVHRGDVASAIVAALYRGRSGEAYFLGGENLDIENLARMTLSLVDRSAPVVRAPRPLVSALAAFARQLDLPLPFNPSVIPYATRYWLVDNAKAKRELQASFRGAEETLSETLGWLARTKRIPHESGSRLTRTEPISNQAVGRAHRAASVLPHDSPNVLP